MLADRCQAHPHGAKSGLRIALTADPELPVPPRLYGGIERIIDMLARGLEARGHEVTLFAHAHSVSVGRLVAWPGRHSRSPPDTVRNAATLMQMVLMGRFDLVHSFSRVAYLAPILPLTIPKLMTYQREISPRTIHLGNFLSRGTLEFSAVSHSMMREVRHIGRWTMVPNGVPLDAYTFQAHVSPDAPLVFLGRVEEIKGPHLAVQIAQRAGVPLVIAGPIPDAHRSWFAAHIAPHIDNQNVTYVGAIDDVQKNALLGTARALLMPILWDEPFGIVMAEAMACGTPVIGLNRGSVPEVIEDGKTGFVLDDVQQMITSIPRLRELNRSNCRTRAEQLYSQPAITERYLDLYRDIRLRRQRGHTSC
jgi:glycosyltransferase involved in cell wall biosynthesis